MREGSRLRHNPAVNQLKMDIQQSITTLTGCGWSQRRIARELGINRETVAKYRREARAQAPSNPAILPAGSVDSSAAKPAIVPTGSTVPEPPLAEGATETKPSIPTAG